MIEREREREGCTIHIYIYIYIYIHIISADTCGRARLGSSPSTGVRLGCYTNNTLTNPLILIVR